MQHQLNVIILSLKYQLPTINNQYWTSKTSRGTKVNSNHHYHSNTVLHHQVSYSYQLRTRLLCFCINIYSPFQLHPLQECKFFHPHFLSNVQDQLCIPYAPQIQEPFSRLVAWVKKKNSRLTCSLKYTINFKEITIQTLI